MKKKVVIAAVAVLLAGALLSVLVFGGKSEPEPEQTAKQTIAATEENAPGVEDSIFDDEPQETEAAISETRETTANTEPTESGEAAEHIKSTEPQLNESEPDHPEDPAPTGPKPTQPSEPTESAKLPEPTDSTEPSGGDAPAKDYTWFQNLSASEQQAWMDSFENIDAFFEWYNDAKEKHEEANHSIEVNGDPIDMDEIINGKN